MQQELELVKKYSPYLLFDKYEPFFPIKIGYTIFKDSQKSPSFPREIVFNNTTKYVIEYAIYWDFDIEHLYDLEHVWVYIDKDEKVYDCEASFHGKYLRGLLEDRSNIFSETHVKLYSQPGKHAFSPLPEFFRLVPNYKAAAYEFAGRDGLIVTKVGEGRYSTSPEINKMVHTYLQKYKFHPSMEFESYSIPEELYVPWTELYNEIPKLVKEKLEYIKERSANMETNLNINEIRKNVIDRLVKTSKDPLSNDHLTMDLWEWPQGVALYGLLKNYQNSNDENYKNYLTTWYENMFKNGLPEKNVNTMAPFLTLAHLYELTKKDEYLEYCREWAEWIMHEMPRTEEGGLQHITTHLVNEGQIWDDTLFMTVLFLAKMGKVLKREDYINESIKQFLLHIKYLFDPSTGLWFHGWTFLERNHFGKVLWGRGNCWFTAGAVEFIEILVLEGALKDYIIDTLEAQVKKLVELQDAGGMWHTVLDDPTSYVETSATAGFAFGILKAVRKGYISDKYLPAAQKAVQAVLNAIQPDGTVEGVSYGTAIGMDKDHYKNIEICPTAYGQALAILLLTEL